MTKIFEFNANKGSLIDQVSGTAGTLTVGTGKGIVKTEKGGALDFDGAATNFQFTNTANYNINTKDFSIETNYKLKSIPTTEIDLFNTRPSGVIGYNIYKANGSTQWSLFIGDASGYSTLTLTGYTIVSNVDVNMIVTVDRDGSVKQYVNGELKTTISAVRPATLNNSYNLVLGAYDSTNYEINGVLYKISIWDNILSQQEINKLYADFVNSKPISKPKRGFITMKPTDLSSQVNNTLGTSTVTGNQSDFSTDPGSISAGNCTGTWNSGTQDFTLTLLGTDFARVQYASKIVAGNKYIVTFKMKSSNYTTGYPTVRDNATDGVRVSGGLLTADYQQYCYTLTAVSTYIQIGITSTVGKDCTIDDISVRPLTGLIAAYSMKPVNSILTDISGNGKNGTVSGGVVSTKDGMLFNGTSGKISSTYTANINSLSFRIKPSVNYTTVPIIIRLGSSGNIYYNQTTGIISYQSGGIGDKNPVTYINGILDSTKTMKLNEWNNVTINFDTYTTSTVIMGSDGSSSFGGIELADLRIYNRVLSLQEIKDYSNSFVKPVIAEDFSSEPADGTAIVPTGWQQVSGTTKIGEINIARGELVTNGNFDSGTTGWSLGVEWTVSGGKAVCDGTQTSNTLLQQVPGVTIGKTYKYSFEVVNYISGSLINYIAGVSLSSKSSNGIYTGIVVATADFIRFYGAVGFAGSIDNVSIVEIDPSLTVKQGTKFIEQVTAGVLAIPSETAYGEWSFDWMKGADGNNLYISFINNTNSLFTSTYSFIASNNEAVGLLKNGSSSGMGITANSYITNNTWYRIKITRSTAGAFTVLIKGGAFTATAGYDGWTLVSVTGGSGSNPVTDQTYSSSNYFVLDLDALDRVANIVISNGIKQ